MKYLKVFTDFASKTKSLNDAEFGRLIRAMLLYAETGEEPELRGNERYSWDMAKVDLDRQADSYKNLCETNKRIATERYGALRDGTEAHGQSRSVTRNKEKEKDKEEDKEKKKKEEKTTARFTPPTLEKVKAYCAERHNGVDAQRWFNYYSANGWMVGKNHMKDWKAAVRTWEKETEEPASKNAWVKQYAKKDDSWMDKYM